MPEIMIFVLLTYVVMLIAFKWAKTRPLHMSVMVSVMIIDLCIPVWLVMTGDWYKRLIEQEQILSSMMWMHFMFVLALYALYVLQIMSARKMLQGDMAQKMDHRTQGMGVLVVRGLVIVSAFMLVEPNQQ